MRLFLLPLTLLAAYDPAPPEPGNHVRKVQVGKQERSYLVHLPKNHDPKKATPVVIALHGATMNGAQMESFSGLSDTADQAGFVVVYPNGNYMTWNSGGGLVNRSDDVAFIGKMLDDLEKVVKVDSKRVYATGMSNGGMMCYRLAAEMSDRIAAIAPVAGTMCVKDIKPKRPVPVMHFHGSDDFLVPLDGPNKKLPLVFPFQALDETLKTWVKINCCDEKAEITELPAKKDKYQVTRKAFNKGKNGAEVILYLIDGGGHSWPGMDTTPAFLGPTTMNISANELMWEFFKKHAMK